MNLSAQNNPEPKKENVPRTISSDELFMGSREIVIRHKDEFYRLSITKAGKLILNK